MVYLNLQIHDPVPKFRFQHRAPNRENFWICATTSLTKSAGVLNYNLLLQGTLFSGGDNDILYRNHQNWEFPGERVKWRDKRQSKFICKSIV